MRTSTRRVVRLALALTVATALLPGTGHAAPVEGYYSLSTRGVAVTRGGLPYKFSIETERTIPGTGPIVLVMTFTRRKSNGAMQKHRWVFFVNPSSFAVGNYPNVVINSPLAGGHGSVNMKFMPETSTDSCGDMINKRVGDLVRRGASGGLSFQSKHPFFGQINRMRFDNATLTRETGCSSPAPDECPDEFRSANGFRTMTSGRNVSYSGLVYPDLNKATLRGEWVSFFRGSDPGDPPALLHVATTPVPPLYVNVDEDLSSATLAGKTGTFFSGIADFTSTETPDENQFAPCDSNQFQPTLSTAGATTIGGDMRVKFDAFGNSPVFGSAADGSIQKLEVEAIP